MNRVSIVIVLIGVLFVSYSCSKRLGYVYKTSRVEIRPKYAVLREDSNINLLMFRYKYSGGINKAISNEWKLKRNDFKFDTLYENAKIYGISDTVFIHHVVDVNNVSVLNIDSAELVFGVDKWLVFDSTISVPYIRFGDFVDEYKRIRYTGNDSTVYVRGRGFQCSIFEVTKNKRVEEELCIDKKKYFPIYMKSFVYSSYQDDSPIVRVHTIDKPLRSRKRMPKVQWYPSADSL